MTSPSDMIKYSPSTPINFDQNDFNNLNGYDKGVDKRSFKLHVLCIFFALLVQAFGWPSIVESVRGAPYNDREVYRILIEQNKLRFDYQQYETIIDVFTDEWLWGAMLRTLNNSIGLTADQIFFLITTFILWQFSYLVASRIGMAYTVFLIHPLVIDLAFSQMRIAFAISIIFSLWSIPSRKFTTIAVYTACTAIHTAIALFALMHFAAYFITRKALRHALILCGVGLIVSLLISSWRYVVLEALGDRRAEYKEFTGASLSAFAWSGLLILLLARWRRGIEDFHFRYTLSILSIAASNILTDGYTTRFIAAAFPSIIISFARWPSKPIGLPLLILIPFSMMTWLAWFGLR